MKHHAFIQHHFSNSSSKTHLLLNQKSGAGFIQHHFDVHQSGAACPPMTMQLGGGRRGFIQAPLSLKAGAGFTLIELLIIIAIIGILVAISYPYLNSARIKALDTRRKSEISQIGKLLSVSCFVPSAGSGIYDLVTVIEELKTAYPQYASALTRTPKDPTAGTETEAYYRYIVDGTTKKCVLYANLQNNNEPVTLSGIDLPTAGGGTGIFAGLDEGWNGTNKYFQVSN